MDQEGRLSISHCSDNDSDCNGEDDVFRDQSKHVKGNPKLCD